MGAPSSTYTAAREELVREQIEMQRMKNAKMRGELISVEEHRHELAAVAALVRSEMLALPGRIERELGLSKAQALKVDRLVREALNRLAGGEA